MRAILATSDKTGVVELGRGLVELGWELAATAGTRRLLREADVPAIHVGELSGTPELLGGRLKTLDLKLFGGLLYRRDVPQDEADAARYAFPPIDLVACNFYPFAELIRSETATPAQAIEHIDVGGPAMIRAAAKNFRWVIPLVDPADYAPVLGLLRAGGGSPAAVSLETRQALAAKVFERSSAFDRAIAAYLARGRG